jgi:hypothetical protein
MSPLQLVLFIAVFAALGHLLDGQPWWNGR